MLLCSKGERVKKQKRRKKKCGGKQRKVEPGVLATCDCERKSKATKLASDSGKTRVLYLFLLQSNLSAT
ncbi:hypothetical protein VNO80_22334 [Phaseolus coccineus]|uniref:Uncharacterized protein n=1 Tax=Phaseolus coccineus TaxID=3886 RepID=A0AAN9QRN6_PHACN